MSTSTVPKPTPAFDRLGGEAPLRRLVDAFYDHMEQDAGFSAIRRMHPEDLSETRDKLFWFLCGWLGGPAYYMEKFGHPRLRARHLPFSIGHAERDQWMTCMRRAFDDCAVEAGLREEIHTALAGTADFMRNRAD